MERALQGFVDRLAYVLAALLVLDRLLKLLAVVVFFRRQQPSPPLQWPTVTLLQPITRGASNLPEALRARARLEYPVSIQHLLICDAQDTKSQAIVAAKPLVPLRKPISIRVNPRFTSQKCFRYGEIVQKSLSVRTHVCPFCGSIEDRDVNATKNIVAVVIRPGQGLQELTYSDG